MTDYKRLTNTKAKEGYVLYDCDTGDIIDRLAELEDKIEIGKMIELPCKIGDTIYGIVQPDDDDSYIKECTCRVIAVCDNGVEIAPEPDECFLDLLGVFATRAEAEARLKELKGE